MVTSEQRVATDFGDSPGNQIHRTKIRKLEGPSTRSSEILKYKKIETVGWRQEIHIGNIGTSATRRT